MTAAYRWLQDVDLGARNSFGVAARAARLLEVDDPAALPALFAAAPLREQPPLVLGGGSNLLFAADPTEPVLVLRACDVRLVAADGEDAVVRAEAGADWDATVRWTLAQGLGGLENLALIPGTVGAAPLQNIGAYGVEVCDRIHAVEAYDRDQARMRRLDAAECGFAYRDSRFKRESGRWVVTAVEFALSRRPRLRLDYAGLASELDAMGITAPGAADVADAVTRIRRRKLPDPEVIGNAGSFFKNPIVPIARAQALQDAHPALPVFPVAAFPADAALHDETGAAGMRKLSAAWLIDACGWKGHRDGDAGVSAGHALVLVNHGGATGLEILQLARRIAGSVQARFGVEIEPEPRLVGATW
jgi:UDP-N-acetylmuramate dehydrogenase